MQELVTRLTGDASAFFEMLDTAVERTKSFATTVVGALGTVGEAVALKQSVHAFTDYQDNLVRLEVQLKDAGGAVQATMADFKAFADQLEATTRVSATHAVGLEVVALRYGIVADKVKDAVKMAAAVAATYGTSPEHFLRSFAMFQETAKMAEEMGGGHAARGGGMRALAHIFGIFPGMGGGKDAAERQQYLIDEINKRLTTALEISEKLGKTFGGELQRITNMLGDLRAELGGIIAGWLAPFVDWLGKAVRWLKELDPATKQVVVALLGLASIVATGGPIMRFFLFLSSFAMQMSPITLAITAAAAATAFWIKYVGGLSEAWKIVFDTISEVATAGLNWLIDFIETHQRLVVAIGLTAAAITGLVIAWKLLTTTITLLDGLLTLLYIKQAAQVAIMLAWNGAMLAFKLTMAAVNLVLGVAGWLGNLLLTATSIAMQITLWAAYAAAVAAWSLVATAANILIYAYAAGSDVAALSAGALATATGAAGLAMTAANVVTAILTGDMGLLMLSLFGVASAEALVTGGLNILIGGFVALAAAVAIAGVALVGATGLWGLFTVAVAGATAALGGAAAGVLSVAVAVGMAAVGTAMAAWAGLQMVIAATTKTAAGFLDTVLAIGKTAAPIQAITDLFRQWAGILYAAYQAASLSPAAFKDMKAQIEGLTTATSGMELAWEIVRNGFDLAVAQIKALWPPLRDYIAGVSQSLWDVLGAGWNAVWATIKNAGLTTWETLLAYGRAVWDKLGSVVGAVWNNALVQMKITFLAFVKEVAQLLAQAIIFGLSPIGSILGMALAGSWTSLADKMLNPMQTAFDLTQTTLANMGDAIGGAFGDLEGQAKVARMTLEQVLGRPIVPQFTAAEKTAQEQRKAAIDQYTKAAEEAVAKAQADLEKLNKQFGDTSRDNAEVKAAQERLNKSLEALNILKTYKAKEAEEGKKTKLAEPFEMATKEIKKWEAALYGSADAYAHWFEYVDRLTEWEQKKGSLSDLAKKKTEEATPTAPPGAPAAPGAAAGEAGAPAAAPAKGAEPAATITVVRSPAIEAALAAILSAVDPSVVRPVNVVNMGMAGLT